MNLGVFSLLAFGLILLATLFISFAIARILRGCRIPTYMANLAALPIWFALGMWSLDHWHKPLFLVLHRWQNTAVPQTNCISYQANFSRLIASYQMNSKEFSNWAAQHPWGLTLGDPNQPVLSQDVETLGLTDVELVYVSEASESGAQLRAYLDSGKAHIIYDSR